MLPIIRNTAIFDSNTISRPQLDTTELEAKVACILSEIKNRKDEALYEFNQKFDGSARKIEVTVQEIEEASSQVASDLKEAIQVAKANVEKFHTAQKEQPQKVETTTGVTCWRKSVAIEKVGLYIPGGTAPLFSTILMLGVPAKIAGCKEIVLCTPPYKEGKINPAILYTAQLVGITKVFAVGGAQAIGAMMHGTETVPQVYKIFGPGNQYVTMAKMLASKNGVAIDMPAGPSELAVIADSTGNPAYIAADLLSQCEHGTDSQVVLFTDSEEIAEQVNKELEKQVAMLPRKEIAEQSLKNSVTYLTKNIEQAIDFSNEYAPEHLILAMENPESILDSIVNAGSVFVGNYSSESFGDYASGTNHTLPTNGTATAFSGVSLDSYVKKITFQEVTRTGLQNLGKTVELMAENEQLQAHKNAVTVRLKDLK